MEKIGVISHMFSVNDGDFSKLYNVDNGYTKYESRQAYRRSLEHYKKSLEIAHNRQNGYERTYLGLNVEIAECYVFLRNWPFAAQYFHSAQKHSDKIRQKTDLSRDEFATLLKRFSIISDSGSLAIALTKDELTALTFADQSKAQLLSKSLFVKSRSDTGSKSAQYNMLKERFSELETQLAIVPLREKRSIMQKISETRQLLSEYNLESERLITPESLDAALSDLLSTNTLLISTIISKYQGVIIQCQIDNGTLQFQQSETQDWFELDEMYKNHTSGLEKINKDTELGNFNVVEVGIEQLINQTDKALSPFTSYLDSYYSNKDAIKLIVTHSSKLPNLPLASLKLSNQKQLIDNFEITILPTITVGSQLKTTKHEKETNSIAIIARPVREYSQANHTFNYPVIDADFAKMTVTNNQVVPSEDIQTNTSSRFLDYLNGKSIWHFSGHGKFDPSDPMQSSLDISDDQKIYLKDFVDAYQFNAAKLAVITSCETGMSDQTTLENEFIGWPTAFMQMGVKGVVATLWRVASMPTSLLICKFYENYIHNSQSASTSLRQAQLWLRDSKVSEIFENIGVWNEKEYLADNYAKKLISDILALNLNQSNAPFHRPYYWAGFVYHGVPNLFYSI